MSAAGNFPFSAVAGQEDVKLALILNLINPAIGGVLISGEKGTAKTTLVRGLAQLRRGLGVVNIPLGVTEDRLTGGIDLEAAIKKGVRGFEEGLLSRAHGQIVYIDEVNLLAEHIVNILLTVASLGENIVEREGISLSHPCRFTLIGSMNPEEGLLRPSFLDKFGLYAAAKSEKDLGLRIEIMKRRLAYEADPAAFLGQYREADRALGLRIDTAAAALERVCLTGAQYGALADLSQKGGCGGHRCEIVLAETVRALAAWNGREAVTDEDIRLAAKFALPHRLRKPLIEEPPEEAPRSGGAEQPPDEPPPAQAGELPPQTENGGADEGADTQAAQDIGELPELSIKPALKQKQSPSGSGKRVKTRTDSRSGRYVKARLPNGKTDDVALDATLRAAALRQYGREKDGVAIAVDRDDLRRKIRERRTGATILFLVDASGSMGARRRMAAVKGAVMALLEEAYQKRDKVGLVAFRGQGGEILLNITRSVDLAQKQLRSLPTGGRTPLAAGLLQAYQLLAAEKLRDRNALQYLVLISDGKANVPLKTEDALGDAMDAAGTIAALGAQVLVLDTEHSYIKLGFATKLAERMGGDCLRLDEISKHSIMSNVKDLIGN